MVNAQIQIGTKFLIVLLDSYFAKDVPLLLTLMTGLVNFLLGNRKINVVATHFLHSLQEILLVLRRSCNRIHKVFIFIRSNIFATLFHDLLI